MYETRNIDKGLQHKGQRFIKCSVDSNLRLELICFNPGIHSLIDTNSYKFALFLKCLIMMVVRVAICLTIWLLIRLNIFKRIQKVFFMRSKRKFYLIIIPHYD